MINGAYFTILNSTPIQLECLLEFGKNSRDLCRCRRGSRRRQRPPHMRENYITFTTIADPPDSATGIARSSLPICNLIPLYRRRMARQTALREVPYQRPGPCAEAGLPRRDGRKPFAA